MPQRGVVSSFFPKNFELPRWRRAKSSATRNQCNASNRANNNAGSTGFTRCASNPAPRAALPVRILPPAGRRHHRDLVAARHRADALARLVAIHAGIPRSSSTHVRPPLRDRLQRRAPVVDRAHVVPAHAQEQRHRIRAARGCRRRPAIDIACRCRTHRPVAPAAPRCAFDATQRQPHDELAALPRPVAARLDRAAVHAPPGCAPASSPMPSPPCDAREPCSPCVNMSNTCGSISARHADAVVAHARLRPRRPRASRRSAMSPPAGVYLAALLSRLANTCARRTGSASSGSGFGGSVDVRSGGRAARSAGRLVSTARFEHVAQRRPRCRRSSILPRVMRETSSRSSTRRTMCDDLPLHHPVQLAQLRIVAFGARAGCAGSCGAARADCAARARAWRGIRPCAGRRRAGLPVPGGVRSGRRPGARGCRAGAGRVRPAVRLAPSASRSCRPSARRARTTACSAPRRCRCGDSDRCPPSLPSPVDGRRRHDVAMPGAHRRRAATLRMRRRRRSSAIRVRRSAA